MLVVFEGIDGSGKSTQVKLFPADKKLSFPRYDKFVGKLIRFIYFHNWFNRLSPYITSFLFALDRFLAKPMINRWLNAGKTVVLDRYTYSSMAHQAAKLTGAKQKKLIDWIDWLESSYFRLPRADKVIFLAVPAAVTKKLMRLRHKDFAEADYSYQQETAKLYGILAKRYRFTVINCLDKNNQLLSKDNVSQKIRKAIG